MVECIVQCLLQKLQSPGFIEHVKYSNVSIVKLCNLERRFIILGYYLQDAEQKQLFNPTIQKWLHNLYKVMSFAEDIVDGFGYDSLRCKIHHAQPLHNSKFDSSINDIYKRLDNFIIEIPNLGLEKNVSPRISRIMHSILSSANQSIVIGREEDRRRLISMLSIDNGDALGVIAILGTAGVGKSTIARVVYNDREIEKHFDLKVWVPVMLGDFNMFRVTKALYESVYSATLDSDLNRLRLGLKAKLFKKRFLFVLDDLENLDYEDWHNLVTLLDNGDSGSRVIITTRLDKVAQVSTYPIQIVKPISNKKCCDLLTKHAYGTYGITQHPNLQSICWRISKKCNGFPLVAKTIGGVLSSNIDSKHWNDVLNDTTWDVSNSNVMSGLLLSYQCIPSHLKRCFTYCSIFSKGYHFDKKHMVLLWMAQGFIENSWLEKRQRR